MKPVYLALCHHQIAFAKINLISSLIFKYLIKLNILDNFTHKRNSNNDKYPYTVNDKKMNLRNTKN